MKFHENPPLRNEELVAPLLYANHVNWFNHCFWNLRLWAPTVAFGKEKPEGEDQQLNNTFRRSASVRKLQRSYQYHFHYLILDWQTRARASVISTSFAKVPFSWRTPFPLPLYNYKLTHFSSHSSNYHGTRNSNYRRNKSNRNALRNTCSVSTS